MPVYYGDIDDSTITDEQYMSNLIHQIYKDPETTSITELEFIVDCLQVSYDFRLAFCQSTRELPELVQRLIFEQLLKN